VDFQNAGTAVAEYKAQGYRVVGVAGMRGAGKTVFLTRLIDALTGVEGLPVDSGSLAYDRLKELKDNRLLARTDEEACHFYSLKSAPDSGLPPIVFVDFSGERLAFDYWRHKLEEKAISLAFLRQCDAYVIMCPLDDSDTYEGKDGFHKENIKQMTTMVLEACEAEGRIDKPLAVVFSKADIYRGGLNPFLPDNWDRFDVVTEARRAFPAYMLALNHFSCLRFCFISTGEWLSEKTENSIAFQTLKDPDAPSFGLLEVYHFLKRDPPPKVMKTQDMIEKQAGWLRFLARIPFLGRRLWYPKSQAAVRGATPPRSTPSP
jgi:hypothetical protein